MPRRLRATAMSAQVSVGTAGRSGENGSHRTVFWRHAGDVMAASNCSTLQPAAIRGTAIERNAFDDASLARRGKAHKYTKTAGRRPGFYASGRSRCVLLHTRHEAMHAIRRACIGPNAMRFRMFLQN
jgi:hypothetical protein